MLHDRELNLAVTVIIVLNLERLLHENVFVQVENKHTEIPKKRQFEHAFASNDWLQADCEKQSSYFFGP